MKGLEGSPPNEHLVDPKYDGTMHRLIRVAVAPALVAAVALVLATISSDYFRERGIHLAGSLLISIVGYALLMSIDLENTAVTYFAIFITTVGVSTSTATKMVYKVWCIYSMTDLIVNHFSHLGLPNEPYQ